MTRGELPLPWYIGMLVIVAVLVMMQLNVAQQIGSKEGRLLKASVDEHYHLLQTWAGVPGTGYSKPQISSPQPKTTLKDEVITMALEDLSVTRHTQLSPSVFSSGTLQHPYVLHKLPYSFVLAPDENKQQTVFISYAPVQRAFIDYVIIGPDEIRLRLSQLLRGKIPVTVILTDGRDAQFEFDATKETHRTFAAVFMNTLVENSEGNVYPIVFPGKEMRLTLGKELLPFVQEAKFGQRLKEAGFL